MALRDNPYLPLYIQDFMTDEKLAECSPHATGIYIRIMCLMHKSEQYGMLFLKDKYKESENIHHNFALMLVRHMPYTVDEIEIGISELIDNNVLYYEGNYLCQKRMISDYDLSNKRALAGANGGNAARYTSKRKLYNEPGYLYIFSRDDVDKCYKIGISKNVEKRKKEVSNKVGSPISIVFSKKVENMGEIEDACLQLLNEHRVGEWINGISLDDILIIIKQQINSKCNSKTIANTIANSDNEIDNDNDININDNIENKKEGLREEEKEKKKKLTFSEDVEYLYSLYPSKCPKRNMGTGKSSNDKKKLESLLKTMPKEELEFTIKSYVEECVRNDVFLKNFSTLLNNLPDMGYLKEQPIIKAQTSKYR